MICKKCEKELPELGAFCPYCGEPREQAAPAVTEEELELHQTPAEAIPEDTAVEEVVEDTAEETLPQQEKKTKLKVWQWILIIVGGILLLGALTLAVLYGLGIDLKPKANDILYSQDYTAEDAEAVKMKDKVVATMGNKKLTNGELQLYYQNLIYTFYNQYYYYMSYMGLDLTQPLDQQPCMMAEGQTWEQYFLQGALDNWQSYTLVEILTEQNGFEVDAEFRASLDGITADLEEYAVANGYANVEEYIHEDAGANVDLEDYLHFNEVYYVSNEYLNSFYVNSYPTMDEIEAYYAENQTTFSENGIGKDMGLQSDVRHILVSVEGGTENEDGTVTYSEEEWNIALAEAERILEEWKNGAATEESFAELANTYTDDPGSSTTGGLYQNVNIDEPYVEAFLNWSIDASRKPGDTEIVKTEYGYHIMYFVEGEEYWVYVVGEELIADRIQEILLAAKDQYPIEIQYKNICLAQTQMM